jgi:hypothetical protein
MPRFATMSDVPALVELARREHGASPWAGGMLFDSAVATETAMGFIRHIGKTLVVGERSYLAGFLQPLGFSRDMIAVEFAWYAEDGQGLQLLRFFEDWARQMGAVGVVVSEQAGGHDALKDRRIGDIVCARRSYTPMSRAHIKRLV